MNLKTGVLQQSIRSNMYCYLFETLRKYTNNTLGVVHKWRHGLGGGGGRGFCDDSTKALVIKRVTTRVKNCLKLCDAIVDDPYHIVFSYTVSFLNEKHSVFVTTPLYQIFFGHTVFQI